MNYLTKTIKFAMGTTTEDDTFDVIWTKEKDDTFATQLILNIHYVENHKYIDYVGKITLLIDKEELKEINKERQAEGLDEITSRQIKYSLLTSAVKFVRHELGIITTMLEAKILFPTINITHVELK